MRLLIEFYHKNILENMIAPLGLTPDIVLFYYDPQYFTHTAIYSTYLACRKYIPHLKLEVGTFDMLDREGLEYKLMNVLRENPKEEIIIDLTGGNELTVVAAQNCRSRWDVELVYCDIRRGKIYNVYDKNIQYGCHSFELTDIVEASSGKIVSFSDDDYLEKNRERLYPMAEYILGNVHTWSDTCTYFQKNSSDNRSKTMLHYTGKTETRPKTGKKIPDADMMYALNRSRLIQNLLINNDQVEFDYKDRQTMGYMSSYGVWLELLTYYSMKTSDKFHDVHTGLKVDWNRNDDVEIIGNEIDTTAMYGCVPVVISCKMSENSTDADCINELYTVSHRISRGYVIRVLVTYSDIKGRRSGIYLKAKEMGIIVMDRSDLQKKDFARRLENAICHNPMIIR